MSDSIRGEDPQVAERGHDEARSVSLELDGLTKVFHDDEGDVIAVDDVSMDIYDGEFVVLVGPSGCGKTTTLRMIAGLEEPTQGSIVLNGRDVAGLEPRERDVAMVFQNYALYPHKTVRENLGFPLQIRHFPNDEIEDQVRDVSELLGIGELLDRRPGDLSGGQQQRVALGRAIIRDPEVFLFDEPLSNLDAKLRIEMRTELNKLHARVGKTSVYVTHDQEEAMTLSDRVAVMKDGKLQQIAPPQTVYERPANLFVAGFIGEPPMNFFDCELAERDDGTWVVSDVFELKLPQPMAAKLDSWDGDVANLVFGVRPEDMTDTTVVEETFSPDTTFEAHVKVVEPIGADKDLTLAPSESAPEEDEFTVRVDSNSTATSGDTVTLAVDMSMSHLFDRTTGTNLTL
ncbi:ABC transporter ATP-binding protein [Halorussus salinisoli]|uniref:ABC transporter ATP-binding protein n=1 Tax=Halorussus salinisoli TaxID=2558242 RepID=UPI0010C166D6|nr:ABC transporter ATP-binding protein [Halorussus salinisoli]